MNRLAERTPVGDYTIQRFIKEGLYNDNYIVNDSQGKLFFLKRFDLASLPERMKLSSGVAEIVVSRKIDHPNVASHVADGEMSVDGVTYPYLVMPFYQGSLLSERLQSGRIYTPEEVRRIMVPVLEGLVYLHARQISHNDISPRNILLEEVGEDRVIPRIIDLGHAWTPVTRVATPFPVKDLNLLYLPPEALKGIFADECDSFSVSALLYTMLFGKAPWHCTFAEGDDYGKRKRQVQAARLAALELPDAFRESDPTLATAITAGLTVRSKRLKIKQLLDLLTGERNPDDGKSSESPRSAPPSRPEESGPRRTPDDRSVSVEIKRSTSGGGFADVAGMESLKKMLTTRVIWVLNDRERAARYRLMPPNGMILYGPPGCGKTFFAQKFAEESRFNYMLVKGSDLGSVYVHGTQGKIASLFKEAQANAPTVICFDEFDAFVPARGTRGTENRNEEVNEFLSQLNDCAQRGIFVIGTTNRLDIIDPAVLRKGRLDLHCEIPAPDAETRRQMFLLHLKGRPLADDIDAEQLAARTDGYAASDIAFIVNEAALVAAFAEELIAQRHLEDAVRCNPSSLGARRTQRPRIGY